MKSVVKIPITLEPLSEGGWLVKSLLIPELITELDDLVNLEEVLQDAFETVKELYDDMGKTLPINKFQFVNKPLYLETLLVTD